MVLSAVLAFCFIIGTYGQYNSLVNGCKWVGSWSGWACDDRLSQSLWQWINGGVKTCNDFCKKKGFSGGQCRATGNYDKSTWCPTRGDACICKK